MSENPGLRDLSTTSRYLNIHRRGLQAAKAQLEEHRPVVALPLHNAEKDAQANVPESDTSAPPKPHACNELVIGAEERI
jgi:hypothetical protein